MSQLHPAALAAVLLGVLAAASDVYVSPAGDDAASGSLSTPFATIGRAILAAQAQGGRRPQILLLNGTYHLEQPVRLTAAAVPRGLSISAVHPGAASLSGGVRISGWAAVEGRTEVFTAALPLALRSFPSSPPRFRQLFVDGVRANRTAFNVTVPLRRATAADLAQITGQQLSNATAWRTGYVSTDPALRSWPQKGRVEAVFTGRYATHGDDPGGNWPWNEARCMVDSVDFAEGEMHQQGSKPPSNLTLLRMVQPCFDNAGRGGYYGTSDSVSQAVGVPDHFENGPSAETLTPGDYFVGDDVVTFRQQIGVDRPPGVAVAPLLEVLMEIDGAGAVTVEGIVFEHAAWHQPSSEYGYVSIQAGAYSTKNLSLYSHAGWELMRAAVEVRGSSDVVIRQCTFRQLGGAGVSVGTGSRDCTVEACLLDDISGTGIILGGVAGNATQNATVDALRLSAVNNHIRDTPAEYHGAVGIFGGYLNSGLIAHNLMERLSYSGVNLGWGWGGVTPAGIGNTSVANNSILDYCLLLNDCGGIYTLGEQPGSSLLGNWISGAPSKVMPWPLSNNQGIYHDQGSAHFVDRHNVLANTDCWLSMNPPEDRDIFLDENFYQNNSSEICVAKYPASSNNTYSKNVYVAPGSEWPAAAKAIMANAGISPKFAPPPLPAH